MSAQRQPHFLRKTGILSTLLACSLSCLVAGAEIPRYLLEDLGTLGGPDSHALATNDYDAIVGWSSTAAGQTHAFLHRDGEMIDLGTLGGTWSEARAINNHGHVVGVSETDTGEVHAFLWWEHQMWDLSTQLGASPWQPAVPPGGAAPEQCHAMPDRVVEANAINDRGWIAGCATFLDDDEVYGYVFKPGHNFHPVNPRFDVTPLGLVPRTAYCVPRAINDHDVVVGLSSPLAFQWERGHMAALDWSEGRAAGINLRGLVVGSLGPDKRPCPVMWQDGVRTHLFDDERCGEALAVNDTGFIVGWGEVDIGEALPVRRATLWTVEGGSATLEDYAIAPIGVADPLVELHEATGIDKFGRIVGFGMTADGAVRAYRLTPLPCRVPE